jgi:hypothetical protein
MPSLEDCCNFAHHIMQPMYGCFTVTHGTNMIDGGCSSHTLLSTPQQLQP